MSSFLSSNSDSKEFNLHTLVRRRELEIARKGFTTIQLPNDSVKLEELNSDLIPVKQMLEKHIKKQADLLHGLSVRIYHNIQLAHIKLRSEEFHLLSSMTMRKVKATQQEYIEALLVMKGLEAFQTHLSYGMVNAKTASRDIAAIKGVHGSTTTSKNGNKKPKPGGRSSWSNESLMKQLKKKEFFPILVTQSDGTASIAYSDTAPFCNHAIALQRSKEIAREGYSMLKLPSGYSKLNDLSSGRMKKAISLAEQARKDQLLALERQIVKLQVAIDIAERYFISGHEKLAAKGMRKVKFVQLEYLHILKQIEALKAYEHSLQYGFLNCETAEDDLEEIKSVPCNKQPCTDSDEDLVSQLIDQKFFPMIFPLLGGGVNIYYSNNPPKEEAPPSPNSQVPNSSPTSQPTPTKSRPNVRRLSLTSNNSQRSGLAVASKGIPASARRLSLRLSG